MGYREVHRVEIGEVIRRWQAGESRRAIARGTGLSRTTVDKYLLQARAAGIEQAGPPADPDLVRALAETNHPGPERVVGAARSAQLAPYRDQLAGWLHVEHLQLTRVHELLHAQGVQLSYTSLRRFVRESGLGSPPLTTVRMAETPPGEVAEMDFGRFGPWTAPSGKHHTVWALVVVLVFSRHLFVWPLLQQTLEAVIEGLEAAWRFYGGVPRRLVLDNFPAAVAGPDRLAPRPTRGFLEYSQARGFLIDPARVRHPKDKPNVERAMPYVRGRLWKGGSFHDLEDLRGQARQWCLDVAGQRVHGTTRQLPLIVFQDQERSQLLPAPDEPYSVPIWRTVTVHPDHHIAFGQALYSVPATTCPPGTKLEVRGDAGLVRLYLRGRLVKVHPSQRRGGRATDPEDYPPERTAYALRAPDRVIRQAATLGEHVGQFAEQLLAGTFPWAKLRQGQHLLRLAERYSPERLEAACARALGFGLVDVHRLERILVLALEQEGLPVPPLAERFLPLSSRFARPGAAFDHRSPQPEGQP